MRILFVTSRSPFAPTRGDTLRAYHQLRVLSHRHDVTLVAPLRSGAGGEPLARDVRCETVSVPWSRSTGLRQMWKAPFSRLPMQVLYVYPPDTRAAVLRLLAADRYDVVHVQLLRMAPVLDGLTAPCVLDYQDAFSLNAVRRARLTGRWRSWALRIEAGRVARYERAVAPRVSFCTVTSAADREALGDPPNCVVIPNGVDLERFPFQAARGASADIVLSGRMSYPPNADAAEWFATAALPRVRAVVPGARFVIVGADPPPRVRRLAALPGVVVTGYVQSVSDYLSRAAVAVAPLRCATGVQNKVLEAMASGTPVVTTPDAVQGIEVTSGRHLLVGRTAEELAGHVCRLLQDRSAAETLARQARALVDSRYTWEHTVTALEHVYDLAASAAALPAGWSV